MKLLQLEALVKGFGGNNVVDGVSFSVSEGEVVGFVGPNGAGKSTTMKMISGLLKPNSGAVSIDGLAFLDDPKRYLAKIGVLIESPAFYPELTARDHLAYLARMRGHWDTSIVRDALAHVGLSADSNKSVRKYSTGMKQRLGIAMAILHNPRVLILDEPTNGLDPAAIAKSSSVEYRIVGFFRFIHKCRVGLISKQSIGPPVVPLPVECPSMCEVASEINPVARFRSRNPQLQQPWLHAKPKFPLLSVSPPGP